MCNTNDAFKFGRGNGTLCCCIKAVISLENNRYADTH
jgi:hypothetical protein